MPWQRNSGTFSFNRGSFVSMETNNTVINYRAKSDTGSQFTETKETGDTAFPQQVMGIINLGGSSMW